MKNKYDKQFEDFVRENVSKYKLEDLRTLVQDKFNLTLSKEALRRYISGHCNEKYADYNKQKAPKNVIKCDIGTERMSDNGIVVKIAQPNCWKLKHRLMYEKYHNCELNSNDCVIFLNQNRNDFSKENLKKISFQEFMYLHNCGTFSNNPDLTKLGLLSAQLQIKAKEKI